MDLKELFAIIQINISTNKAILNEKAKKIFTTKEEIEKVIKCMDLNKKVEFSYVGKDLYVINILKDKNNIYLLFSKVENDSIIFNTLKSENSIGVDLYQKEILREFLEKFLALKRRYGGFSIKFLYLRIEFVLDLSTEIKRGLLHQITKYMMAVTRSSDVVGQISENEFGIILTNARSEGANILVSKIVKFISEINNQNEKRIIEAHAALMHEILILKNTDFNGFIDKLRQNASFITVGMKLKELIK